MRNTVRKRNRNARDPLCDAGLANRERVDRELLQYNGVEKPGEHPAIIEPRDYERVIRRLQALKPGPRPQP
jgi:hypothetical protein